MITEKEVKDKTITKNDSIMKMKMNSTNRSHNDFTKRKTQVADKWQKSEKILLEKKLQECIICYKILHEVGNFTASNMVRITTR